MLPMPYNRPEMDRAAQVTAFWQNFLRHAGLPANTPLPDAGYFGSTAETADACVIAVMHGIKTCTSALQWNYERQGRPFPRPGDHWIVTDWGGTPACVVETVRIQVVPWDEVDCRIARDYGEGDRTLEWWRREMWAYYAQECRDKGWEPRPDMPLVVEWFRVVYPSL